MKLMKNALKPGKLVACVQWQLRKYQDTFKEHLTFFKGETHSNQTNTNIRKTFTMQQNKADVSVCLKPLLRRGSDLSAYQWRSESFVVRSQVNWKCGATLIGAGRDEADA